MQRNGHLVTYYYLTGYGPPRSWGAKSFVFLAFLPSPNILSTSYLTSVANKMSRQRIGLLLTFSLLIGICIWTFLLWTYGTLIPEPYISRFRQLLPLTALLFILSGLVAFLVEYKHDIKGYTLNAFACWLVSITLLDIWFSKGGVTHTSVWLFLAAISLVLLSLRIQIRSTVTPS
jgi:hypothetical protein